jgi:LysM repeat protein
MVIGFGVYGVMLTVAPTSQASSACGSEYVISSGDTLGKVAKRCGHSVAEIVKANAGINPNAIRVGQRIAMPGASQNAAGADLATRESVSFQGRIVNGRWCALLETPEGEVYGLRSREIAFSSNKVVAVEGKLVEGECGKDRTIMVTEVIPQT